MHNKSDNLNGPEIKGIIFDLDGVLTDTAEYHYQAWRKIAIEEDIPFNRKINEKLRGISRRRSLETMLQGRRLSEEKMVASPIFPCCPGRPRIHVLVSIQVR